MQQKYEIKKSVCHIFNGLYGGGIVLNENDEITIKIKLGSNREMKIYLPDKFPIIVKSGKEAKITNGLLYATKI